MMTHDEVMEAAEATPTGFGHDLIGRTLLEPDELTNEMRKNMPDSWIPLAEASDSEGFYTALIDLWRQGCGDSAFAPQFLKKNLRYAAFTPSQGSIPQICYITRASDDNGFLLFTRGSVPLDESFIMRYPDYGPLTTFCRLTHGDIGDQDSFVRHPSWTATIPLLNITKRMDTWEEYYARAVEDHEEQIIFSEYITDRTDEEGFRPDPARTIQFGKTNSDNFVEPGDPVRFWSFWNGDGEMQLQSSHFRGPTVNAVDENLAYLLGY